MGTTPHTEPQPIAILAEFDGFRWLASCSLDDKIKFTGRTVYEAVGKMAIHHKDRFPMKLISVGLRAVRTYPAPVPATPREIAFMEDNIRDGHCGSSKPDADRI